MTDQELIDKVVNDADFPKRNDKLGLYVEGGRVYQNFVNSDGKPMRRYFYFGKYNLDGHYVEPPFSRGTVEVLVYGAEFINMSDAIDCYFANVTPKQFEIDLKKSEWEKYSKLVDSTWIKESADGLVKFINEAPTKELDEFLTKSGFYKLLDHAPQDPRKE